MSARSFQPFLSGSRLASFRPLDHEDAGRCAFFEVQDVDGDGHGPGSEIGREKVLLLEQERILLRAFCDARPVFLHAEALPLDGDNGVKYERDILEDRVGLLTRSTVKESGRLSV